VLAIPITLPSEWQSCSTDAGSIARAPGTACRTWASPDAIYAKDPGGRFVFANPAGLAVIGARGRGDRPNRRGPPIHEVRTAVLYDTLEDAFRYRYPGFRPANDAKATPAAA
jgi:hypothetical protein